ncbi:MAG: hypothetical protein ACT4QD_17565 [Acidobacteriota bacterium]
MRVALSALILFTASVAPVVTGQAQQGPPQQGQPVFRGGIELLTVDATVIDRDGRQVTDLTPAEFVVEVDGDPRPVVSAEYLKLVDDTPRPIGAPRPTLPAPSPDEAFFSTNARTLNPGRLILLLVDQGNIRVGQGRQVMRSATGFVDRLSPVDRVALVAIPRGALVDFTMNHERVREGLLATVGQAQPFKGRFNISLTEAIVTVERSDALLREQLFQRECGGVLVSVAEIARCEIEVEQEAGEIVSHQRQQTMASLRSMREVLRSLAPLEGPKSVILISEGLVLEGLTSDVDDIAAVAADVRASLDVMLLDVPSVDVTESQRPTTPREDRDRQVEGLESLAGIARGGLHRVISSGENAFDRILRSLAGHYLIGVESRPRDRDGRRHRISVKSLRRGLTVYSRRGFLATTSPEATSPEDAVGKALRAPLTLNDLPMRLSTWTLKEPGGNRVRVLFSAEVDRADSDSTEYTMGVIVVDANNRVVANHVESRTLNVVDSNPGRASHAGSFLLDPGRYLVRFAIADREGRLGSVERRIEAWQMNAAGVTVGDLIVAPLPAGPTGGIMPSVEPLVRTGRLAALMEVYAPDLKGMTDLQGLIEIVRDERGQPLTSASMPIAPGATPEVGLLQASVSTAALPPGRYLARATVTESGKPRGHLVRPFRVEAGAPATADTAVVVVSALPPDVIAAVLGTLPGLDRKDLVTPDVLSAVLASAERARPTAKAALASARAGKLGPAALEALEAGDQPMAAFLRGVDFFVQGQDDRAMQQLQVAMQQAPTFAPARLFLGAALAQRNRHREAAGLLQSVPADVAGTAAPVAYFAALSWLHAGNASLAVSALEQGGAPVADGAATRTLALALVAANRATEAAPLLSRHLQAHPDDKEALLAGVFAIFVRHSPTPRGETLGADQAQAQTWARAYAAQRGAHQALVDAWMGYLRGTR